MEDSLAAALTDRVPNPTPMGITAENLANKYGITRKECDEYALQSQKRWKEGSFAFFIWSIALLSE
jgi:acetyl-CoA acyltransferase 2